MTNLSDAARKDVETAVKLMRLAGKNTNQAEAESATAKAMDLLAKHNLDLAVLSEAEAGEGGRRMEEKLVGGFYEYEQQVWRYVAELNFCVYWHQKTWVDRPEHEQRHARVMAYRDSWRRRHILRGQHRLIGRRVNVEATKAMASYLLQAIERECRSFVGEDPWMKTQPLNTQMRSRSAVSFREGAAEEIVDRLWARRQEQERAAAEEARRAQERAAAAGASLETAVTIASVRQSEHDANIDFVYGEGWSAKQRQARADAARRAAEEEAAYTAWAAANPEEAAKKEAERVKEKRSRQGRSYSAPRAKDRDWGAFRRGGTVGQRIGLDQQAEGGRSAGALS